MHDISFDVNIQCHENLHELHNDLPYCLQENTNTEVMWIRIHLFIGLFYGKQQSRNNNIALEEDFNIIERHLYQYTTNNQNHTLMVTLLQKLEMENKVYPMGTSKKYQMGKD